MKSKVNEINKTIPERCIYSLINRNFEVTQKSSLFFSVKSQYYFVLDFKSKYFLYLVPYVYSPANSFQLVCERHIGTHPISRRKLESTQFSFCFYCRGWDTSLTLNYWKTWTTYHPCVICNRDYYTLPFSIQGP